MIALGTVWRRGLVSWLLFWMVTHALLGAALAAASGWILNSFAGRTAVIMPVLDALAIGAVEWYLLRQHLTHAEWWFFATSVAALIGALLVWGVGPGLLLSDIRRQPVWYVVTAETALGIAISLAQAVVLRREDERYSRRAVEWLVFGSAAYGLARWSVIFLTIGKQPAPFLGLSTLVVASPGWLLRQGCIGLLSWTGYGVVTALALARWPDQDYIGHIAHER